MTAGSARKRFEPSLSGQPEAPRKAAGGHAAGTPFCGWMAARQTRFDIDYAARFEVPAEQPGDLSLLRPTGESDVGSIRARRRATARDIGCRASLDCRAGSAPGRPSARKSRGEGYSCGGGFGFAMPGMLAMWTAGTVAHADPEVVATLLQRNSDIVIQLHLRSGKQDRRVQASIGLYFANQPPQRTPIDLAITSYDVDIPAGKRDHKVAGFSYVPVDVDAFSIFAHAHFLATGFKVIATLPGGETKPSAADPALELRLAG